MVHRFLETLAAAVIGGFIFSYINVPLPWMLGPLTISAVWKTVFHRAVFWPVLIRNTGLMFLGFMMGTSFNRTAAVQIMQQLPSMFLVTSATVLFSFLIGLITSRGTGISFPSAIIGSVPGGLSQMLVLGEEIPGADITAVAFMQTVRLLSVVFIVPFIVLHGTAGGSQQVLAQKASAFASSAGSYSLWLVIAFSTVIFLSTWGAVRLHFPTPFLIGPLLGTAALVLAGVPAPNAPHFLKIVSQLCVGTYMGASIQLEGMKNWKRMFFYTFAGSIGIVAFSMANGALLSYLHHLRIIDTFLCTAPGGMAEMGITALMVHGDLSLVSSYQLFRVLFILFIVPLVLKHWFRDKTADSDKSCL